MIRTAAGERNVEDLVAGDLLPTVFGEMRPIQWIARSVFIKSDPAKPWAKDVLPVRVARSALETDVPHSDLYITSTHALLIDAVLVPVCSLINGTTITVADARDRDTLEYFHIKLESHDVIYAAGAPCETLYGIDENAVDIPAEFRQFDLSAIDNTLCAPLLGYINGGPREITSRFRSALSPWIDCRRQIDVIRDKLEERGIALQQQSKTAL